ncbi:GL25358, partial [Drosophila persimilis]
ADIGKLAQGLQTEKQSQSSKPEVQFFKYRTPEDAVRAQQLIQQQFDALGGSSRNSNERCGSPASNKLISTRNQRAG